MKTKIFTIALFILGFLLFIAGITPPFLSEMMINNTVEGLNNGAPIDEIKPVIGHIMNGYKVSLLPLWLCISLTVTGLFIIYISVSVKIHGINHIHKLITFDYWKTYSKTKILGKDL